MAKVLISGGSGLIGTRLTQMLLERGHQVAWLSRKAGKSKLVKSYAWDWRSKKLDPQALEFAEVLIHLAGKNVGQLPWTEKHKKEVYESRIQGTRFLVDSFKKSGKKLMAVLAASAIGFYGDTGDELVNENSSPGTDFMAETVKDWEQESQRFEELLSRLCILRIGLVLTKEGGLLEKFLPLARFGLLSGLGTGEQMMSWIHIDDLCRQFLFCLEHERAKGTFNAVASIPVSNKHFVKAVNKTMRKPNIMPRVPAFALRLLLGEFAQYVLGGQTVSNEKIQAIGFRYDYGNIMLALKKALKKD